MLGSEALEVGIGVSLFFLIVSLLCSAAREAIETVLKSRARDLERGIRELLDDPSGENLAKSLFDHGQVFGLFAGIYDPGRLTRSLTGVLQMPRAGREGLPSYIPKGHFASALIDIVARGPGDWPFPVDSRAITVDQLRAQAGLLPSVRVQRAVLSAIDHGEEDLNKIKAGIEAWYDGGMDRVSGWYKRRTQIWLFVLGLTAAAVMNLDALTLTRRLIDDKTVRTAFVAEAERVQKQGVEAATAPRDVTKLRSQLGVIDAPIGWAEGRPGPQTCRAMGDPKGCVGTGQYYYRLFGQRLPAFVDLLVLTLALPLALTWLMTTGLPALAGPRHPATRAVPKVAPIPLRIAGAISAAVWLVVAAAAARFGPDGTWLPVLPAWGPIVGGWLVTAGAVTFGAPFWFDALNKLMVIRSTVKPHEKSPEEASDDRQDKASPATPVATDGAAKPAVEIRPFTPPRLTAANLADPDFEPDTWRPDFVNKGEIVL